MILVGRKILPPKVFQKAFPTKILPGSAGQIFVFHRTGVIQLPFSFFLNPFKKRSAIFAVHWRYPFGEKDCIFSFSSLTNGDG